MRVIWDNTHLVYIYRIDEELNISDCLTNKHTDLIYKLKSETLHKITKIQRLDYVIKF